MYRRLKWACYCTNLSMSVVGNLPPVLFLTFRELYGISYSRLGLLVLINFVTQLTVDVLFSFFSHRFPTSRTVRLMPALTALGLMVYALWPFVFPQAVYAGLVAGTIIFSASSGLNEVLTSPVIAAIPSEDPDREMSKLHSVYAWGVVGVVLLATALLYWLGRDKWQWIALGMTVLPIGAAVLFQTVEVPALETPGKTSDAVAFLKNRGLWLCVAAIFLGGASECTMAQWASGYLEKAMGIPKVLGDALGVALFAFMLGLGRTLYSRWGRRVETVLLAGSAGAFVCYTAAALGQIPVLGLAACALTGLCVSMLWPGSLLMATARFPAGGVFVFAMMAAGGDLGASIGPQLIGAVTDAMIATGAAEQAGLRAGMLLAALFPLLAAVVYFKLRKEESG